MTDQKDAPFYSLVFMQFQEPQGRSVFRIKQSDQGMYTLSVESGSAANGTHFSREIPESFAQTLKDELGQAGVFAWEESYGGDPSFSWSLKIVFKQDVFSIASQGKSELPAGFNDMLEAFYKMDFPRPSSQDESRARRSDISSAFGDPKDLISIDELFSQFGNMGSSDIMSQMQDAMQLMQEHPEEFERQMRAEFASLPPAQQNAMIDLLASMGPQSREWWERFLRGL